jgi:MoaD family protein
VDVADQILRVRLRCFAAAREAAGRARDHFDLPVPSSLSTLLERATDRYGAGFAAVLTTARVWVNEEEPAQGLDTALAEGDEVAILPPVSGGS